MKINICLSILLALVHPVWAYNQNHGPFAPDDPIDRVLLEDLSSIEDSSGRLVFELPEDQQLQVFWEPDKELWYAEVIAGEKVIMEAAAFSPFDTVFGIKAQAADLNQDGRLDYILYSYSGGVGLASGYCNVAFILSTGQTYTLIPVMSLFPDESAFTVIDGQPCFIHTSFHGVDKCTNGKSHNFWVYNLLVFKNSIIVRNEAHPDFPKIIWYSFRPNHEETDLLTDKQKSDLHAQSLAEVFWRPVID